MKNSEPGDLSGDFETEPGKNTRVNSTNDLKRMREFKIHHLGLDTRRKG